MRRTRCAVKTIFTRGLAIRVTTSNFAHEQRDAVCSSGTGEKQRLTVCTISEISPFLRLVALRIDVSPLRHTRVAIVLVDTEVPLLLAPHIGVSPRVHRHDVLPLVVHLGKQTQISTPGEFPARRSARKTRKKLTLSYRENRQTAL